MNFDVNRLQEIRDKAIRDSQIQDLETQKEIWDAMNKRFDLNLPFDQRPEYHPYNSQKEMEEDMVEIPKVMNSWQGKIIEQLAIKNQLEEASRLQDEARKNIRKAMSISVIAVFISILSLLFQLFR